jgi:hypothetical protein
MTNADVPNRARRAAGEAKIDLDRGLSKPCVSLRNRCPMAPAPGSSSRASHSGGPRSASCTPRLQFPRLHIDMALPAKDRTVWQGATSRRRWYGTECAAERGCCFPASGGVDDPAIASVVKIAGATMATVAALKSMLGNMKPLFVSIRAWPLSCCTEDKLSADWRC